VFLFGSSSSLFSLLSDVVSSLTHKPDPWRIAVWNSHTTRPRPCWWLVASASITAEPNKNTQAQVLLLL